MFVAWIFFLTVWIQHYVVTYGSDDKSDVGKGIVGSIDSANTVDTNISFCQRICAEAGGELLAVSGNRQPRDLTEYIQYRNDSSASVVDLTKMLRDCRCRLPSAPPGSPVQVFPMNPAMKRAVSKIASDVRQHQADKT